MILKKTLYAAVAMMCFVFISYTFAAENPGASKPDKNKLWKITGKPTHGILNINNITTWMRSDGEGNHSPGGDNGVYYPIGTGNVVYEDGLMFGGKVFLDAAYSQPPPIQGIRVGGSTYLSNMGTKAGHVIGSGATAVAADPDAADVRVYRIRRDYYTMTDGEAARDAQLYYELADVSQVTATQIAAIRQQYDTDWTNWPTAKGAPYVERTGNNTYDKPPAFSATFTQDELISGNYDEPGVAGSDPSTPADQAMYTIYNDLNVATCLNNVGSNPIGLEVQKLAWAYKRTDALGNVYFTRYRIINKGGVVTSGTTLGSFYIDSMYVCQWSDIDLGDAGEDVAGCDTTLSMGYVYNGQAVDGTFIKFGLPPPSSGYDFLGGPRVAGAATDSAIFDLKVWKGQKNLPMTSFAYFSAGSIYTDPRPWADYDIGTGQWWKMLRGYAPLGTIVTKDTSYRFPPGVTPTKFPFAGDPTKPASTTNFLDGMGTSYSVPPGDRRILLNTGPFRLAPSDTQEIYVGFVVGIGSDRISSVSVMKANDIAVQTTFDYRFQVAKPPAAPIITYSELNEQVIFEWGSNPTRVKQTETAIIQPGAYSFQGYNVYQLPSANSSISDGKKIAVYDIIDGVKIITDQLFDLKAGRLTTVDVQTGGDNGVGRHFIFKKDYLKDVNKLYNGKEYFLAITAYSYTTTPGFPTSLETTPVVFTVRPKVPFGVQLTSVPGDSVKPVVKTGVSDGQVVPMVVNPANTTGHIYTVKFQAGGLYSITDSTTGVVKTSGLTNQSGGTDYPIVDGVMVQVFGPVPGMKSFTITGTRRFSPVGGFTGLGLEGFSNAGDPTAYDQNTGTIGMAGHFAFGGVGTTLTTADYHTVQLRMAAIASPTTLWDPLAVPTDPNISKGYRWVRSVPVGGTAADPSFAPWIINRGTGYPYQDFNYGVPFSAWDMDVTPPQRLAVGHFENNVVGGYVDGRYWPGLTTVDNSVAREFAFIFAQPYSTTEVPAFQTNVFSNATLPLMWVMTCARRNDPPYVNTDIFQIDANHVNSPAVTFSYTAPSAPTANSDLQLASANRVTVFPNPYYGFNKAELTRFDRFVTFNNLPQNAIIRIFNVAGHLVRTLRKNNTDQFLRWSLTNEYNYPVASGMYIAYVDMPDVPATKVVKFAIIQEQEVLDIF